MRVGVGDSVGDEGDDHGPGWIEANSPSVMKKEATEAAAATGVD